MGKRDIALARYFEDEDRYADLINGFVFRGEPVISGENILDKNTRITGFVVIEILKSGLQFKNIEMR